ncbi:MAG: c-type cytochrome [Planctomycetota bacterium]|nr:c-type cytochrome [Planctomycetota bacterium]MDA1252056.1 c-type cytochrome [Planctomycetota bacterium]
MQKRVALLLTLVGLVGSIALADDFPKVENTEKGEPPLTPQQALAALELPEGFKATLFAAEPDVRQPIALATDSRGRLWVAENYSYAERERNFDDRFRDRIVILEDEDHDGQFDKRTVFWDQGRRLTSVEIGHGGVWVLDAPNLLFIPDKDGDDKPDGEPVVMLDGWDDAGVRHNIVNGLRWGPDGWLYGRHGILATSPVGPPGATPDQRTKINCGIWRFHPTRHKFEVVCHGGTNAWGMDWDANGEPFYINTVIGHLWHIIPGAYYRRMYGEHFNPNVYDIIEQTADHFHWDTKENWSDIRKLGVTNTTDEAGGGHAHCGMIIAQFPHWPKEFFNSVLTVNLHGRRINRDTLHRDGATFTGKHGSDFIKTTDPWFRGVELHAGRWGELYIADWSDTGECHENDGVHRSSGRIFRITYEAAQPSSAPRSPNTGDLRKLSSKQLVERLGEDDEWQARMARLILAERASTGDDFTLATASLRKLIDNAEGKTQMRALWTLHATGGTSEPLLMELLGSKREEVRSVSVRMLAETGVSKANIEELIGLANEDSSGLVLTYLASLLQKLPHESRWWIAKGLTRHPEFHADRVLPLMIWYGLEEAVPGSPEDAVHFLMSTRQSLVREFIARRLAENLESNPDGIDHLVKVATQLFPQTGEARKDMLVGMSAGLKGWRKARAPKGWSQFAELIEKKSDPQSKQLARELSVVFGDGRALQEIQKIAFGDSPLNERRAAIRSLVLARADGLVPKLQDLLGNRDLAEEAIYGLAAFNTPETPDLLVDRFGGFRSSAQGEAINTLVSRPNFAQVLLAAIQKGRISRDAVSAFQIRQMQSFENAAIGETVSEIWPELKQLSAEKKQQIEKLRAELTPEVLTTADRSKGRLVFATSCANCHKLFDDGRTIGPELTGAQRTNLNYLLENIVDPSATVSKNFQLSIVVHEDGRVFSGVVVERKEKTITIQTSDRRVTIARDEIDETRESQLSLMPENQLKVMSDEQIRDLIGYLMSPSQVPLPDGVKAR